MYRKMTLITSLLTLLSLILSCGPQQALEPVAAPPPLATPPFFATSATPTASPTILSLATPTPSSAPGFPPTPTPSPETASTLGKPRYGGVLVSRLSADPEHLDPSQTAGLGTLMPMTSVYNTLLRVDPVRLPQERVIVGDLAKDWKFSSDGTSIVFQLRDGIQFHDGKPLTSADVKATIERVRDAPGGIRSPLKGLIAGATVETPNPLTAIVKFPDPYPLALEFFATPMLSIVPKHVVERDQKGLEKTGIGTGAFKFSRWDREVQVEVVRNERYWEKGLPYLNGIRWLIIPDSGTQVAALRTGRLHVAGFGALGLSKSEGDLLREAVPDAQVGTHYVPVVRYLFMNITAPPFNDVKVRQAVALALDQRKTIEGAWESLGYQLDFTGPIGQFWALPEGSLNAIPTVRGVTDADLAKARELLAQAGHTNGLDVEILLLTGLNEKGGVVSMDQLRRAGFRLVGVRPPSGEWSQRTREKKYDVTWGPVPAPFYDPAMALAPFTKDSPDNITGYTNPRLEEIYRKLLRTVDTGERKRLVDEAQAILWQDVPAVPSANPFFVHALRPEVKGFTHPGMLRDNFRFETLWLETR